MNSGHFPERTGLGRYGIVKRLGRGDTSEVLLAVSHGPHGFERLVVLKRLLPQFEQDAALARMLAIEAIAYARLAHPAIVRLYDFFELDGHAVLVLEYVDGTSLAELQRTLRARGEKLSDAAALYVASRVFAALAAAHAARDPLSGEFAPIVHRDVSPGSVLLPWDGFAKLGDFGFAKVKELAGETSDTRHGVLKGTIGYMAPEQVLGERITPRTDVYGGCLLLRELLVDAPAFGPTKDELEILRAMAEGSFSPIERVRSGISPPLADAMRRGLTRDPEARTLTAAEMVRVLRQETDLGLGHVALVDTLSRVRPEEQLRASTPPAGAHAIDELEASETLRFERLHLPPEAVPSEASVVAALYDSRPPAVRHDTPGVVMLPTPAPPPVRASVALVSRGLRLALAGIAVGLMLGALALFVTVGPNPSSRAGAPLQAPSSIAPIAASIPSVASSPAVVSTPPSSPAPVQAAAPPPSAPPAAAPTPAATVGTVLTPERARSHRVFVDGHYAAPRSGAELTLSCGKHVVRIGSQGRDQTVDVPCGGSVTVEPR